PDGKTLAAGGGWKHDHKTWSAELNLWDLSTGKVARSLKGHKNPLQAVAFAPDGASFAAADVDGFVTLWDTATGLDRWTIRLYVPGGHRNVFWIRIAFSPDGKTLATAEYMSSVAVGKVRLWNPDTGAELHTLPSHAAGISGLAF